MIEGAPLIEATLIYKSTGINFDGETFIPKVAEEALIAFVHFQEALNEPNMTRATLAMVGMRKQEWQQAVTDMEIATLRMDDLMDAVYSTIYQGVKR